MTAPRAFAYNGSRMTAEERAEVRRTTWAGGLAHSHAAADAADLTFWREATPSQRFDAVVEMAIEAWVIKGGHGAPPRLQRAAGGVRRREG